MTPARQIYYVPLEDVVASRISLVEHARGKLLYHELAQMFDLAISRDTQREVDFIDAVLKIYCPSARSLIDLGCGIGRHGGLLNERYHYHVTGIDISEDVLSVARTRYPGCQFSLDDFRSLKVSGKFDAAICMWTTFNYLSTPMDVASFFAGVAGALTPRGILIIDTKNYNQSENCHVYVREAENERWSLKIQICKRVVGSLNEAIYKYEVTDLGRREVAIFEDQEIARIYSLSEIMQASSGSFTVLASFGDYDLNSRFEEQSSVRLIVILKKKTES